MSPSVEIENSRSKERKSLPGETPVTVIPVVEQGAKYPPRESWEQATLGEVEPGRKVIIQSGFQRSGLAGSFMSSDESAVVIGPAGE
jgi:hypothetical protein